jgi:hypothetical protein
MPYCRSLFIILNIFLASFQGKICQELSFKTVFQIFKTEQKGANRKIASFCFAELLHFTGKVQSISTFINSNIGIVKFGDKDLNFI